MEVLKIVDWGWVMCWRVKVVLDILCYGVWSFIESLFNFLLLSVWDCVRSTEKCIYSIDIMYELWTMNMNLEILFWGMRNEFPPFYYYSVLWIWIWIFFLGFLSTIKVVGFWVCLFFWVFTIFLAVSVFCSQFLQLSFSGILSGCFSGSLEFRELFF